MTLLLCQYLHTISRNSQPLAPPPPPCLRNIKTANSSLTLEIDNLFASFETTVVEGNVAEIKATRSIFWQKFGSRRSLTLEVGTVELDKGDVETVGWVHIVDKILLPTTNKINLAGFDFLGGWEFQDACVHLQYYTPCLLHSLPDTVCTACPCSHAALPTFMCDAEPTLPAALLACTRVNRLPALCSRASLHRLPACLQAHLSSPPTNTCRRPLIRCGLPFQ